MSSILSIKIAMGWQPLNQRAACCNCARVEERITVGISTWYCTSGHFHTTVMAICNRHMPRGAPTPTVMPPLPASRL